MTDFTAHWHWPQWVMACLILLDLIVKVGKHGQVREYNGFYAIIDTAIMVSILVCGSFFA